MSTEMDKELDLILNSEKEVKVGNKKIIVHKISMLDSIKLASHFSVIATALVSNSEATARALTMLQVSDEQEDDGGSNLRLLGIAQLFAIVGNEGADLLEDIIEKCTNLSPEEVETIPAEDGIDLLFDIYDVNKSFFTKLSQKLGERLATQTTKKDTKKTKKA